MIFSFREETLDYVLMAWCHHVCSFIVTKLFAADFVTGQTIGVGLKICISVCRAKVTNIHLDSFRNPVVEQ